MKLHQWCIPVESSRFRIRLSKSFKPVCLPWRGHEEVESFMWWKSAITFSILLRTLDTKKINILKLHFIWFAPECAFLTPSFLSVYWSTDPGCARGHRSYPRCTTDHISPSLCSSLFYWSRGSKSVLDLCHWSRGTTESVTDPGGARDLHFYTTDNGPARSRFALCKKWLTGNV